MNRERLPAVAKLIPKLDRLANTPLGEQDFRQACDRFGWRLCDQVGLDGSAGYLAFAVPTSNLLFCLNLDNGLVTSGWMILCFWEPYLPRDYSTKKQYRRARKAFDNRFARVLDITKLRLGKPIRQGVQRCKERFRYAVWRGETCLLKLWQGGCIELTLGLDLHFELMPWDRTTLPAY
jgi:hypothetical protein